MTKTLASENKSQCTFACHGAAWSPDGSRIAYADGDQTHVMTMRSDDGTDQVKVSIDDPTGRSHFPVYLADGRLAYVTEHINPGQSWTDIWAVDPGATQPPTPCCRTSRFRVRSTSARTASACCSRRRATATSTSTSPRSTTRGKDALKKLSSDTELAPALAAAGHPAGLSTTGQASQATSAQADARRRGRATTGSHPASPARSHADRVRAERVDQRNRYPASRYQPVCSGARRPGRRLGAGRGGDDRPQAKQKEGHTI